MFGIFCFNISYGETTCMKCKYTTCLSLAAGDHQHRVGGVWWRGWAGLHQDGVRPEGGQTLHQPRQTSVSGWFLMLWSQSIYGHRTASISLKIVRFYSARQCPAGSRKNRTIVDQFFMLPKNFGGAYSRRLVRPSVCQSVGPSVRLYVPFVSGP